MLHEQFELKNAASTHWNGTFQLQNFTNSTKMLQRQLKWKLPAPKCCKWQGKRAEKQIQKKIPKRGKHNSQNNSWPFVNFIMFCRSCRDESWLQIYVLITSSYPQCSCAHFATRGIAQDAWNTKCLDWLQSLKPQTSGAGSLAGGLEFELTNHWLRIDIDRYCSHDYCIHTYRYTVIYIWWSAM